MILLQAILVYWTIGCIIQLYLVMFLGEKRKDLSDWIGLPIMLGILSPVGFFIWIFDKFTSFRRK